LFFEGGGWCVSLDDCYGRSSTALGSSSSYAHTTDKWNERDIMDYDCTKNPAFCTWTHIYTPYCDGTSRSSWVAAPVSVRGKDLHFRGFGVVDALMSAVLAPAGPGAGAPSLATATHLLVSGSSAGGLTTYLHADYVSGRVAAVNPSAVVKAVPEVGFFIDGASIWDGKHLMTEAYTRIATFGNISTGAPAQVNAACMAAYPDPSQRWHCFEAQYTYPYIATPTFILNSQVDEWQTSNILAPNSDIYESVSPYPAFQPCIKDPPTSPTAPGGCNATQAAQWTGYGGQFLDALAAARNLTPPAYAAASGGFITSCPIHTTAISGLSHRITIDGVTMYDAAVAWFWGTGSKWYFDKPYPGNPSCPKATEETVPVPESEVLAAALARAAA
jgi:O-palmitoleoyl-L-serine hydrolase